MKHALFVAAALAALTTATTAEAAKLATAPLFLNSVDGTMYNCTIAYVGASKTPITALVTAYPSFGPVKQTRLSFSANGDKRGGWLRDSCDTDIVNRCQPVYCTFSFTAPASDFRAAVCVVGPDFRETCLPAS